MWSESVSFSGPSSPSKRTSSTMTNLPLAFLTLASQSRTTPRQERKSSRQRGFFSDSSTTTSLSLSNLGLASHSPPSSLTLSKYHPLFSRSLGVSSTTQLWVTTTNKTSSISTPQLVCIWLSSSTHTLSISLTKSLKWRESESKPSSNWELRVNSNSKSLIRAELLLALLQLKILKL